MTTAILAVIVPIVLLAIFTVVVTVSTASIKKAMGTGIDKLRQSPSWPEILSMAKQAVRFAEQLKLTGKVADEAKAAKDAAIKALQAFLDTQGWGSLDVEAIDALIESAYNELKAEFDKDVPELSWASTPLKDFTQWTGPGYVSVSGDSTGTISTATMIDNHG